MPSSPRSLCSSLRRSGSGPFPVDRFTAEVLPAGQGTRKSIPGQVRGWSQSFACEAQAQFPRKFRRASATESLRSVASPAIPRPLGSLFKTPLRRRTTRTSLSRPVHPPCGNLKPSARRAYRQHGHVPLARLGSQKQKAPHDPARQRVPSPVPVARAPARIRPHPPLRADGTSPPGCIAPALPAVAGGVRPSRQRSRPQRKGWYSFSAPMELSALRRSDGSYPTVHRYGTSITLSASSDRPTTMTQAFLSRNRSMSNSQRNTCGPIIGTVHSGLIKAHFPTRDPKASIYQFASPLVLCHLSGIQNP